MPLDKTYKTQPNLSILLNIGTNKKHKKIFYMNKNPFI